MTGLVNGFRLASIAVAVALIVAPAAAEGSWSGAAELTDSADRDGAQLVIDANPAGDLVAAWQESVTDDIAVVFKPAAAAAGAPQRFAGDFELPDVAIGPGSVAVLAFDDDSGYGSVYAASKAAAASSFSDTFAFDGDDGHTSPDAPPSAAEPRVAVNGFGTGMLFFGRDYYNPPSYTDIAEAIEGRVLNDPSTNSWSGGTTLNTAVKDPREMEVSVGPDGSAFLGISFFSVGPCWGLESALLEDDGSGSAAPASLTESCADAYNGVYPSNDRLPNNDVVMAWGHSGDDSVRFLDLPKARALTGGAEQDAEGDEVRLDAGDDSQTTSGAVRVRTDAAGNTIVVWHTNGGAEEAILARVRPAGGVFGPVEVIDSGENYMAASRELDFDVDAAGNGYLVYSQRNAPNDEIMGVVRSPDGTWSNPKLLSGGQGIAGSPAVAASGGGRAYAAWIANSDDGVYYSTFQAPADDDETDPAGGGNPPAGGGPNVGAPTATVACTKAGNRLARTKAKVAKAKRKLRKTRAKTKRAGRQVRKTNESAKARRNLRKAKVRFRKARKQVKTFKQRNKRAARAKRLACS